MESPAYDASGTGLPKRWEMVALLFSGITVVYILRVIISVAAQDMRDELGWSETQKGFVLSAFYWGYSAGQIPASRFVQSYGAKSIFGLSVLIPSVLTIFMPPICKSSYGLALVWRALIGLFESATFPAVFHFFPIWVPLKEKTLLIPAIVSGMYMGEIIGFSLSGVLVSSKINIGGASFGDWPSVFYIFGLVGVLWYPFWVMYAYERPTDHPSITREEMELICEGKLMYRGARGEGTAATPLLNEQDFVTKASAPPRGDEETAAMVDPQETYIFNAIGSRLTESGEYPEASDTYVADAPVVIDAFEAQLTTKDRELSLDNMDLAKRIPWKAFFTNIHALTLFVNSWAFGFVGFTLLSEMPSFLTDELGFDLSSAGIMCVFPYLGLFFSTLLFGRLFLYLEKERGFSTDSCRRMAQWAALVGSVGGLLICGFLNSNAYAAYAFIILSQAMLGPLQSGLGCAYSDISPTYSSALNSVGNTIAAIAGIVGPIVVSVCLDAYPGILGWRVAFFVTAGFALPAACLFQIFQTSKAVPAVNTPCARQDICF